MLNRHVRAVSASTRLIPYHDHFLPFRASILRGAAAKIGADICHAYPISLCCMSTKSKESLENFGQITRTYRGISDSVKSSVYCSVLFYFPSQRMESFRFCLYVNASVLSNDISTVLVRELVNFHD